MNPPDLPVWVPLALAAAAVGWWRLGHPLVAAALVAVLAVVLGVLPHLSGTTATGGPLAPGAPVPQEYRPWIEAAGSRCPDVTPALLAAQLSQESGFDPDARGAAGERGVAQFMPSTWQSWAVDANGNGSASPLEPADAIAGQARFMCALAEAVRAGLAAGRLSGGVVDLSLAAYNAGPTAVQRAGGMPAISSTRAYVANITALARDYSGDLA